ncbi:MAG: GatB/YqeY domain-containing protein [Gemmatimonadota bacterium]|jgi:uncharacterized protein YqeY|nr:GatB/YqeY domain-containing protein [Gemmatimonadota bacterium]
MSEPLKQVIRDDLNNARKDRDKLKTTVFSTFLSEIRNREIETGKEATDDDVRALLITAIKRRRESVEQMRAGGREELAAKEEQEAELLKAYLPPELSEAEVRVMVKAAIVDGAKDLGAVMKVVLPRVRGQFEGKELNRIIREELA